MTITVALEALQNFVSERHGCWLSDDEARAACLALIENWPGMAYRYRMSISLDPQEIILPLQENQNDKG